MKIGLVGFPGSGKTTVFNTMTGLAVPVGFGGELRIGTVRVPDERIDRLSRIFKPKKTTYAEMSFSDIPGEHGSDQKGLSTRALQQIRDQEALCLVIRDFRAAGEPDPLHDLEAFHLECSFADLDLIERRLDRMRREQGAKHEQAVFERMKTTLEEGRPLRRRVREGAQHEAQDVLFTDALERLARESLAFRAMLAGDVAEDDLGVGRFLRFKDPAQRVDALVRYFDGPEVHFAAETGGDVE